MFNLNLKVSVVESPPTSNIQWYAVMHDVEAEFYGVPNAPKGDWRLGLPEVFVMQPDRAVEMTPDVQRLCFDLYRYGAPSVDLSTAKKKYRVIYQDDTAFCNRTGYPHGHDNGPKADWINMLDLNKDNPTLDKPRFCGGSLITGRVVGDMLLVKTMRPQNLPSLQETINKHLYFWALNVGQNFASDFAQGLGEPVLIPLISLEDVYYPLNRLRKLPLGYNIDAHDPHKYNV